MPIASTTERSTSSGRRSGAIDRSIQARATTAKPAGAQASSSGRATSGAESDSRAAQRWNGTSPNRIAAATATAR